MLATLDHASGFKPEVTVFACNRQPWDHMDETLPAFDEQPAWKPKEGLWGFQMTVNGIIGV